VAFADFAALRDLCTRWGRRRSGSALPLPALAGKAFPYNEFVVTRASQADRQVERRPGHLARRA
jgi:hypothetical protein